MHDRLITKLAIKYASCNFQTLQSYNKPFRNSLSLSSGMFEYPSSSSFLLISSSLNSQLCAMLLLEQRSLFTEKCFGKMTNGRFLVPRPPRTNGHVVLDVNKKCRGFIRWRRLQTFVGFEPASNSREFTYGSNVIKTLVTLQFLCRREQSWTCANGEIWWQGTVCFHDCIPASAF